MRKKVLIIIGFILLLSGCTAKYDVVIKSDNSVSENLKITIPNSLFNDNPKKEINNNIEAYKKTDNYGSYKFKEKVSKNFSYIEIQKNHSDLNSFILSPFVDELFQNVTIIQNEEFNTFQTVGFYNHEYLYGKESETIPNIRPDNSMEDVVVTIKLYNKVIETNADKKDEKNNIYTWNLDYENKEKSIYIKYSNDVRYDVIIKSFFMDNVIIITLIGTIFISILSVFIFIFIRNSSNNKT